MKKVFVIIVFLLSSFAASAQLINKIDLFLSNRYYRGNYDTTYIARPAIGKWTLAVRTSLNWTNNTITFQEDEDTYKFKMRSELNPKFSIYASYLGLGASFSRSYKRLSGQDEPDWSFKFNNYGNHFGLEFSLSEVNSMKGTLKWVDKGLTVHLPENLVNQISFYLHCYFAVNSKKFSYPAAFTYSFTQKRSAGSLLIGGVLNVNLTDISISDSTETYNIVNITNFTTGVGVGYGYNFVLPQNWLLHVSALPYLVINGGTRYTIDDKDEESSEAEFPESYIVGRTAVIHAMGRWFVGVTGQVNYYNIRCEHVKTGNTQWEFIGFVGVRL
ncbi:MAG: DUF4421 family protein [Bacteroidales bacterium]|nr:DUF4421 family protein [Bacteroidales bacterium]